MPDGLSRGRTALKILLLAALVIVAWHGAADRQAASANQQNLERSLLAYTAARGLNAIISVAQGTEVAVQPIGVGVTITIGEALDPLNDLIERFSWVVLLATISLGAQALLIDMGATTVLNVLVTTAAVTLVAGLWWTAYPGRQVIQRIALGVVFVRFVVVATAIVGGWIDDVYLAARQSESLEVLETAGAEVKELQQEESHAPGVLERITGLPDPEEVRDRIARMEQRIEASIAELINLAATFVLQTLLLPLALLWLALTHFRRFAP